MVPDSQIIPMLTVEQVAHLLNVHSNTVRNWCKQGRIKSYRVNPRGPRRFKQQDIDILVSNLKDN